VVFWSVIVYVTHVNDWLVNDGICADDFALTASEYRNYFDTM